jgi:hypothetical protein
VQADEPLDALDFNDDLVLNDKICCVKGS